MPRDPHRCLVPQISAVPAILEPAQPPLFPLLRNPPIFKPPPLPRRLDPTNIFNMDDSWMSDVGVDSTEEVDLPIPTEDTELNEEATQEPTQGMHFTTPPRPALDCSFT